MCIVQKNNCFLSLLFFVGYTTIAQASDFVTITTPANSSTVSGLPLSVTGTSSQPSTRVRVTINTTETGSATTNSLGDWSITSDNLFNGSYTITADLMDVNSVILATATNSFTISNQAIQITDPASGEIISTNPITIFGSSSAAATTVNLSVDGNLAATTTTDSSGNWSTPYTFTTNGTHTLLAQLIIAALPVASSNIDVTASIPVFFTSGTTQMRVIGGTVPTTGSGTGSGYSYSNSGSVSTITFTPAFAAIPVILATGRRTSGASTITISSVSSSATNMTFSSGTTSIQFNALLFS